MGTDFVTWTDLGTYAGVVAVTALITQFLKQISFLKKVNVQILSYIVAVALLEAALFFSGAWELENAMLCLVNGIVVSLASNGAYDVLASEVKERVNIEEENAGRGEL